jgi:hypothetical protein
VDTIQDGDLAATNRSSCKFLNAGFLMASMEEAQVDAGLIVYSLLQLPPVPPLVQIHRSIPYIFKSKLLRMDVWPFLYCSTTSTYTQSRGTQYYCSECLWHADRAPYKVDPRVWCSCCSYANACLWVHQINGGLMSLTATNHPDVV